jgi:hypothetical protein
MMKMANYKIKLDLSEQQINILYDALQYYTTMNESMGNHYSTEDVNDLFETVSNLYLEDEVPEEAWQLTPAAKAFIEQFGSEELMRNYDRWQGFKAAFDLQEQSSNEQSETQV